MDGFIEAQLNDKYREQQYLMSIIEDKNARIAQLERQIHTLETTVDFLRHEGTRNGRRP